MHNAGSSMWRNRLAVFFSAIGLSLIFFLVHLSTLVGVLSDLVIENLEKKIDIAVFIERDATLTDVETFRQELAKKRARGEIINYWELPKEKALEEFKRKFPDETQFLDRYEITNPLATVFGIVPQANQQAAQDTLNWLKSDSWHGIIDQDTFTKNAESKSRAEQFLGITRLAKETVSTFRIVFLVAAFFLLFYTVSLIIKANFREMTVMRLVGASMSFIRAPFIIEGLSIALVALWVSTILFVWTASLIERILRNLVSESGIGSSFLIEFFSSRSPLTGISWDNGILLFIFSFLAAALAVEYALRRKNMFSDF